MKTSLAIVLATIALTFGAMLSVTSGVAAHDYGNLSGKSPGASPLPGAITLAPGPRPLSQSLGCESTSRPLPGEAGWYSLEATEARNAEVHDR